jgi:hypothetical protein
MASKPRLNEEDYERIETYLNTSPFERSPEDLLPEDAEE